MASERTLRGMRRLALVLAGVTVVLVLYAFVVLAIVVFAMAILVLALVRSLQRRARAKQTPAPPAREGAIDADARVVEAGTERGDGPVKPGG